MAKQVIAFLIIMLITLLLVEPEASEYDKKPEVARMLRILQLNSYKCLTSRNKRYCRKGWKPKTRGTGWCYRYVKLGLVRSGLTSVYIGGGSAKNAGPHLKKEGFINILADRNSSPLKVPRGSIFVYRTLRNKHGHIEVKLDEDIYISDYVSEGTSGYLLGIYLKEDLLNKNNEQPKKEETYGWFNDNLSEWEYSESQSRERSSFNRI